jgi:hypothetical protein
MFWAPDINTFTLERLGGSHVPAGCIALVYIDMEVGCLDGRQMELAEDFVQSTLSSVESVCSVARD